MKPLLSLALAALLGGLAWSQEPAEQAISRAGSQSNAAAQPVGWTRFRGPNGSGVAEALALPAKLDPQSNLAWRRELPPGHSSPVLWGGRVYLTALEGERLVTLCLDAADGELLWRRSAPAGAKASVDARNHPASPTPVVGPEGVFVFFPDYGLLGYDHLAEELWRLPLGPFENVYGMGASPILVQGLVVLACDQNLGSYLLAVDAAGGEERWRVARPEAKSGHCTPILASVAGTEPEILLPGSFLLDAYAPADGSRRWFASGLSFEMKSVPVLWRDRVFVAGYGSPLNQPGNQVQLPSFEDTLAAADGDGDGRISQKEMPPGRAANWFSFVDLDRDGLLDGRDWAYLQRALASQNGLLGIRLGGSGDVTGSHVDWAYRRSVPQLPSPLVYRDVLHLLSDGGGMWTRLRPESGEVLERVRLEGGEDSFYASPVAGDGKIFLVSEQGLALVVAPESGARTLGSWDLGERVYATPALAPGRVYLRTEQALYCFE